MNMYYTLLLVCSFPTNAFYTPLTMRSCPNECVLYPTHSVHSRRMYIIPYSMSVLSRRMCIAPYSLCVLILTNVYYTLLTVRSRPNERVLYPTHCVFFSQLMCIIPYPLCVLVPLLCLWTLFNFDVPYFYPDVNETEAIGSDRSRLLNNAIGLRLKGCSILCLLTWGQRVPEWNSL